jgi:hypothetical protein
MQKARALLEGRFPDLEVHTYFLHLDGRVEKIG